MVTGVGAASFFGILVSLFTSFVITCTIVVWKKKPVLGKQDVTLQSIINAKIAAYHSSVLINRIASGASILDGMKREEARAER